MPKFLAAFKDDLQAPGFAKRAKAAEAEWRGQDAESSAKEAYEDALKHGTIVSIEDATPSDVSGKSKRRKVDFADMMRHSKGKQFGADAKASEFQTRGEGGKVEGQHEEEGGEGDGSRGLDYIANKIGSVGKSGNVERDVSRGSSRTQGSSKKEKEKEKKRDRKKKHKKRKALRDHKLLSFDFDQEG